MKKSFKKLHLWLSIPVGLFVSLICITGAILVFETEISEYANSERYFVSESGDKRLTVSEIVQKVSLELPDSVSVSSVQISSDVERTYRLGIEGQNRTSVYVNPYSGDIIETYTYDPNSFFAQVRQLHRWLMFKDDSRIIGKRIVGISTIVMIAIIVTGLVVWVPRNRKVLKNRLRIRFKSGWRMFWYDLHIAGGFYFMLLLLVMALTGLTWSFEWYRNGFYGAFGVEMQQSQQSNGRDGREQERDKDRLKIDYTVWDKVVDETLRNIESYKTLTVTSETVNVVPNYSFGNSRASDRYKFDRKTGAITEQTLYAQHPKQGKIRGWIYSVHTGSWGGIVVKILYFIAALIGCLLPLTGYYLWFKRKSKRKIS
ncbi:Iron-uptake factor PiuB [Mucinivorans hirudinis]|uniref:Iron-uptake factor PiuB n=1 Tax=Mucinivorans hirudinis TaxID=1433126 RepID=A0A060R6W4_9BACT|nr:Iron-uptake factor PiuB [Mucinivorans hirudinis]